MTIELGKVSAGRGNQVGQKKNEANEKKKSTINFSQCNDKDAQQEKKKSKILMRNKKKIN